MLRWALIFLIIALVAALFGFTAIAAAAAGIAKFWFVLFLVICLIFFIMGYRQAGEFRRTVQRFAMRCLKGDPAGERECRGKAARTLIGERYTGELLNLRG
jgi:uncharacterized membrane protein YtjA (UPF0391 family)